MPNVKSQALSMIATMPEEATWEQILDRIDLRAKIEEGFADIEAGNGIPHDQFKKEMSEWLRSLGPNAPANSFAPPSHPSTAILT